MASTWIVDRKVEIRADDSDRFDEMLLYGEMGECVVHAEMMDDGTLWIGLYPMTQGKSYAVMWIKAEGKKLDVQVQEE